MPTNHEAEIVQQIRKNLEEHNTQYLVNIWKTNDRHEWAPEAFEAIHEILIQRLGYVPSQKQVDPREDIKPRDRKQKFLPSRIEGEIQFQYLSPEKAHQILSRLRVTLSTEKATNIHLSGNKLNFDVALFRFVSRYNLLGFVDKGEIIAHHGEQATIKYSFSFMRTFVISIIIAVFFFLVLLPGPRLSTTLPIAFLAPTIMWLFLFGINYIIAVFRLQDFVWQAI